MYSDYLKSDHWQNTRKMVIRKQGDSCRICGSKEKLNIHHRKYSHNGKSLLGNEINQLLLPLCGDCHGLWHRLHGLKHLPFPTIKILMKAGIPKLLAFQHPYSKVKTLKLLIPPGELR